MDSSRVCIHVGMNKTGSSFLQQQVFPQFPAVYYNQPHFAATHRFAALDNAGKDALRAEFASHQGMPVLLSLKA